MTPSDTITLVFALLGAVFGGIVGPALSWITEGARDGRSLQEISEAAQSGTRKRRPRATAARSAASGDEIWGWAFAAVVIVTLYVRWRPWILVSMATLGACVGFAASVVALIAWFRRIIAGTWTVGMCLILPFLYGALGIVVAALLWRTPFAPSSARAALSVCQFRLGGAGFEGFNYLVYTIFGGALYVILALGTVHWQMSVVAAIYAAEGVRPNRFWRSVASRLSLPLGRGWVAWGICVSVLAVLFSGGWAYTWLAQLQR